MIRSLNALALLLICIVLTITFYLQFFVPEMPCPLCLLQRYAMLLVGVGLFFNLRFGLKPSHYGLIILSAALGLCISTRQVLLHIVPGSGHYGEAVFGLHLYTWSVLIFFAMILAVAVLLLWNKQFAPESKRWSGATKWLAFYLILLVATNVVTTFMECGPYQCPATPKGYWLFSSSLV